MDVLPAIPDSESTHLYAILIPDRELQFWQHSNPREYVEWFKKRMELRRIALMEKYAAEFRVSIDDVPEYRIKTPLQRSIQIMKRHRDFMFQDDTTYKPISIIITTLAAKAYLNEENVYETLNNIIPKMSNFISIKNDLTWIENPTNDEENFAERWNEDSNFEENFMVWLRQIHGDIKSTIETDTIGSFADTVNPIFGEELTKSAFEKTASAFGISVGADKIIKNVSISGNPSKPWGN